MILQRKWFKMASKYLSTVVDTMHETLQCIYQKVLFQEFCMYKFVPPANIP